MSEPLSRQQRRALARSNAKTQVKSKATLPSTRKERRTIAAVFAKQGLVLSSLMARLARESREK